MDTKKRIEDLENSIKELEEERIARMSKRQFYEHIIGILADSVYAYDPKLKNMTKEERRQWLKDYFDNSYQKLKEQK